MSKCRPSSTGSWIFWATALPNYRVHRGEKHLTPEMQEQVKKVFAEYGYGEPAYDHYAEEIGFIYE